MTRENNMYLSYSEVVIITIALGINIVMLVMLGYANAVLLSENRFLKRRLRAWRENCNNKHTEVPF